MINPEYPKSQQTGHDVYFSLKEISVKHKIPLPDFDNKIIRLKCAFSISEIIPESEKLLLRIRKGTSQDAFKIMLGINNVIKVLYGQSEKYTKFVVENCSEIINIQIIFINTKCIIKIDEKVIFEENFEIPMSRNLTKTCISFGGHDFNQKYSYELFKGIIYNSKIEISDTEIVTKPLSKPNNVQSKIKLDTIQTFFDNLESLYRFDANKAMHMKSCIKLRERKPNPAKIQRKVIVCNDIPVFISEDLHLYGDFKRNYGYRFNFWNSIDIFCYFSHHFVMIPPHGYIGAAHRNGCKMIGVLITEGIIGTGFCIQMLKNELKLGNEIIKLPDNFYADKLIEICLAYDFDGYLLNIENDIPHELIPKLLDFITYLRGKLQFYKPTAEIIWYDSILESGELSWQSALTRENKCFYDISDMFFTDYHWRPSELATSVYNSFDRSPLDISFGTDLYGRGTYQGGKLNTYKAIDEILKYPLSIALFGSAYYYQNDAGYKDTSKLEANDKLFWHGDGIISLANNSGMLPDFINAGMGWNKSGMLQDQYDEEQGNIVVCSMYWASREIGINLQKVCEILKISRSQLTAIEFETYVKGTAPNYKDPYKIYITAQENNKIISLTSDEEKFTTENWELAKTRLDLEILPNANIIVVTEMGRDAENMKGFYGARFGFEWIRILYRKLPDATNTSLTDRFNYRRVSGQLPFSTNFNNGMGKSLSFCGNSNPIIYNNVSDYDFNLTYAFKHKIIPVEIINGIFPGKIPIDNIEVSVDQNLSYFGNSSLKLIFKVQQTFEIMVHKLYKCCFPLENDTMFSIVLQTFPANLFEFYWLVKLSNGVIYAVKLENQQNLSNNWILFTTKINTIKFIPVDIENQASLSIRSIYLCAKLNQNPLKILNADEKSKFLLFSQINIGHFSIFEESKHFIPIKEIPNKLQIVNLKSDYFVNPKTAVLCENDNCAIDLQFCWDFIDTGLENLISHYQIYMYFINFFEKNRDEKWIGNTYNKNFVKNEYLVNTDKNGDGIIRIKIQPVTYLLQFAELKDLSEFIIKINGLLNLE